MAKRVILPNAADKIALQIDVGYFQPCKVRSPGSLSITSTIDASAIFWSRATFSITER